MAEPKTQKNDASVKDFIATVEPESKRQDCEALLEIFEKATGEQATMWGAAIIGFGKYHYKSERSKQEGDWPMTSFSPRKANFTLYIMPGTNEYPELLAKLGKHKVSSGSCIYINRLSDIDTKVLTELIRESYKEMEKRYHV